MCNFSNMHVIQLVLFTGLPLMARWMASVAGVRAPATFLQQSQQCQQLSSSHSLSRAVLAVHPQSQPPSFAVSQRSAMTQQVVEQVTCRHKQLAPFGSSTSSHTINQVECLMLMALHSCLMASCYAQLHNWMVDDTLAPGTLDLRDNTVHCAHLSINFHKPHGALLRGRVRQAWG